MEHDFNPRSPCGERPEHPRLDEDVREISIHAPRAGSDRKGVGQDRAGRDFNPRSPCGERLRLVARVVEVGRISIHAPRAGSDTTSPASFPTASNFNPRSPCGERRCADSRRWVPLRHFNPRSPCGERLAYPNFDKFKDEFQSTLPVRGATPCGRSLHGRPTNFNPRSPCGERRLCPCGLARRRGYFNPRSPCGERPRRIGEALGTTQFQSTLPVRGATAPIPSGRQEKEHFNPRSPCGERRDHSMRLHHRMEISIHAPRAGSDRSPSPSACSRTGFQSTLPVRGATRVHRRGL